MQTPVKRLYFVRLPIQLKPLRVHVGHSPQVGNVFGHEAAEKGYVAVGSERPVTRAVHLWMRQRREASCYDSFDIAATLRQGGLSNHFVTTLTTPSKLISFDPPFISSGFSTFLFAACRCSYAASVFDI